MISSDKNVDKITLLVEKLRHYLGLQTEFVKLDATEKAVRLITVLSMIVISFVAIATVLLFLSMALAYAIGKILGLAVAFLIVAIVYFLLFLIIFFNRKRWIEKPLVRLLSGILLEE